MKLVVGAMAMPIPLRKIFQPFPFLHHFSWESRIYLFNSGSGEGATNFPAKFPQISSVFFIDGLQISLRCWCFLPTCFVPWPIHVLFLVKPSHIDVLLFNQNSPHHFPRCTCPIMSICPSSPFFFSPHSPFSSHEITLSH